jgi:hypothetical protein
VLFEPKRENQARSHGRRANRSAEAGPATSRINPCHVDPQESDEKRLSGDCHVPPSGAFPAGDNPQCYYARHCGTCKCASNPPQGGTGEESDRGCDHQVQTVEQVELLGGHSRVTLLHSRASKPRNSGTSFAGWRKHSQAHPAGRSTGSVGCEVSP